MIATKSSVYADVCEQKGIEYITYDEYMIKFG